MASPVPRNDLPKTFVRNSFNREGGTALKKDIGIFSGYFSYRGKNSLWSVHKLLAYSVTNVPTTFRGRGPGWPDFVKHSRARAAETELFIVERVAKLAGHCLRVPFHQSKLNPFLFFAGWKVSKALCKEGINFEILIKLHWELFLYRACRIRGTKFLTLLKDCERVRKERERQRERGKRENYRRER